VSIDLGTETGEQDKTRDIYKVVGCLMPYWQCALTSAQLKLSSVRFMQPVMLKYLLLEA